MWAKLVSNALYTLLASSKWMSMSPSEICFPSFAETCSFSFDLDFNWKENTNLLNRDYKMPVVIYSFFSKVSCVL